MNRSSGTSSFSCFLSSRSEQETQAGDLFRGQLTAGATRSSKRPRPIAGRGGVWDAGGPKPPCPDEEPQNMSPDSPVTQTTR